MGTWGAKLLDNDDARDLEVIWDEWIVEGRKRDPQSWTPERIAEFLRLTYFRDGFEGAIEDSDELLAVGALYLRDGLELPTDLRSALIRAASLALRPERLEEWSSRSPSRKKALLGFLSELGAAPTEVDLPKDAARKELAILRTWAEHFPQIVHCFKEARADDDIEKLEFPSFINSLGRCLGEGTRHRDDKLSDALMTERVGILAFVTSYILDMTEAESLALIDRARTQPKLSNAWMIRSYGHV